MEHRQFHSSFAALVFSPALASSLAFGFCAILLNRFDRLKFMMLRFGYSKFALLLSCTNKMTFSSVTAHCKPFNRQQKLQFIFPSFLHKIYFFFDLLAGFRNCCFAFAPLTRTYAAIKMLNLMWCSMLIRVCSLHTYPAYTGQHLPFPVRFWRYSVGGKWEEEMVFRSFSFALFRKMEQKYRKKHFQRNKTKC